ncbi:pyruvate kinase [Thiomicrorhabdus hydrogeniphila]
MSHVVSPSCVQLPDLLNDLLELKQRIESETEKGLLNLNVQNATKPSLFSLVNLLNYVVMRREELHGLQSRLAQAGLSSLGRVEPHVMTNINAVIDVLTKATTHENKPIEEEQFCVDYEQGYRLLQARSERMFGQHPKARSEYIMVTMPTEATTDRQLIETFFNAGMNNARINCAHDNEDTWLKMITNIRLVARNQDKDCKILMDLAGHKIRTGDIVAVNQKIKNHKKSKHKKKSKQTIETIAPRVYKGDWVLLCKALPKKTELLENLPVNVNVMVTCTYDAVIDLLEIGQSVWFDDGKIGLQVKELSECGLLLQITQVGPKGAKLKTEKGINLPDTILNLPTLSKKDCKDLTFVSQHADMIGLSFTECANDVLYLQEQLTDLERPDLPILVKIETADGVQNLPDILLQSLAKNIDIGVMIARGDLAVELGSVRMAEMQDAILRLCESAHIPVVWATQVLESLAKEGTISRAEITDAATSQRAECIMLNKGPYIAEAVSVLSHVLQSMEAQQFKSHTHFKALKW